MNLEILNNFFVKPFLIFCLGLKDGTSDMFLVDKMDYVSD